MFDLSVDSVNTFSLLNNNTSDNKPLGISVNGFSIEVNNNFISTEFDQIPLLQQAIELATKTLTSTAESDHYDMTLV